MEIIKLVEKWVKEIHFEAENKRARDHLLRTGYWLKRLNPKADLANVIAAITHDVERAFPENRKPPSPEFGGAKWDDEAYDLWHGKRSAAFIEKFLKKQSSVDKELLSKIKHLVTYHDFGGDEEVDLIKDADSISFLEIVAPIFISWIPEKFTKKEVKEKLDLMFNRISSQKAKSLARPFYAKAIKELD